MKNSGVILILIGLVLVVAVFLASFLGEGEHDAKDLAYWMGAAGAKDWSAPAAQGMAPAQFYLGVSLVRTNLVTMTDRVPGLSAIPLVGRRFFQKISYAIDGKIPQEQLAGAYGWIKKSADQGFAPAREAQKLFIGRIPGPSGAANGSQPVRSQTNSFPGSAPLPGPEPGKQKN